MVVRLFWLLGAVAVLAIGGAATVGYVFWKYGQDLPDHSQLATYEPPVATRVLTGDGALLAEYAVERRVFVPVGAIPPRVKNAFLAAEDQHFYSHFGIDPMGLMRAIVTNVQNAGSGRRPIGASTITQQVAQVFLITKEVTIERKIREWILAIRLERTYTKDRILELYLNEIYLGYGAYGVAAAARNYFDKSLEDLTVAEAAYLAALPKAPNNYHPIRHTDAATTRRDYVIERMLEDGYITRDEADAASATPLAVSPPAEGVAAVSAEYFAEEVRRTVATRYGETALYKGGLTVRTTLDTRMQRIAEPALRLGLIEYDRRHGYRGPLGRIEPADGAFSPDWPQRLAQVAVPAGADIFRVALVTKLDAESATLGFADGAAGTIPLAELKWARRAREGLALGPSVRTPADALAVGEIVLVDPLSSDGKPDAKADHYTLRQVPQVSGAIVALDPHTGRVLAMVGGFSSAISEYNRATQARRQPGSAFKPFVYMTALDNGYTPASIILDAPFVIDQGARLGMWKPDNYEDQFYGPSTLRLGVEKSRNLMTVRLAQSVGMDKIAATAKRFGVVDDMPEYLSMALGSAETSLLRLATAYGMIVNGGKRIEPTFLDRVQDRYGVTVFRHDGRNCTGCQRVWDNGEPPIPPDLRPRVIGADTAYQMVSILQGVVERGTGKIISDLGRPLAGKTGTTNESRDNWFVGFSPDLVVGVYIGYDQPRSLGQRETGAATAAPIFKRFMAEALKDAPKTPFRIPPGIRLVRVSAATGQPAKPGDRDVILEAFKTDQDAPREAAAGGQTPGPAGEKLRAGQY
ncbi:MAG: penicillin-binding protein 1A [Alphaproteobacteria bacterium]|nr:penicillin-binding protein 1A [Alphaproteobacteria bacterium]